MTEMEKIKKEIEAYLPRIIESRDIPGRLGEAMCYALSGRGKRLRPFLFLKTLEIYSPPLEKAIPFAWGLEAIHTYSLVHDDLPIMDDDDYRRGRLTTHRVYGEANALLVGDGLFTLGCELMNSVNDAFCFERMQKALAVVLKAVGPEGMVGGQYLDLKGEGLDLNLSQLEEIHRKKTGALITASLLSGGILGGAAERELGSLEKYGQELGLLFQITDDLLDLEGDPRKTGKSGHKDAILGKATYPGLMGIEGARKKAEEKCQGAIYAAKTLGEKGRVFRELAEFVLSRDM